MINKKYITLFSLLAVSVFSCGALAKEDPTISKWKISGPDLQHARNANYGANRQRWLDAKTHASRAKDPLIKKIFLWRQYNSKSKHNKFSDITKFIKENPTWPNQDKLAKKAEESIKTNTRAKDIVGWFTKKKLNDGSLILKEPLTPKGKLELTKAIIELGIKSPQKNQLIKNSWIENNFSTDDEREFLIKFQKNLDNDSHIKRTDRLIWDGRINDAKRVVNLTDSDHRKLFEARINLHTHRFGLDRSISKIPEHLKNNEGLLYDRIKWREKMGKIQGTIDLLRQLPEKIQKPKKWWKVRKRYIFDALEKQDYHLAYNLAKGHSFANNTSHRDLQKYAEAEWLAGWIALNFQNSPKKAYNHFHRIYDSVKTPISLGRAAYWAGRAAEKNKAFNTAYKWYKVAGKYPTSFYGQLASQKIDKNRLKIPSTPFATWADKNRYQNNELVKAAYILSKLGKHSTARKFVKHSIKQAKTPGEQTLIAEFGLKIGRPDYSVSAAKEIAKNSTNTIIKTAHYPSLSSIKNSKSHKIKKPEKALIHAITLQESIFDRTARSHAGASGLMQLMPGTASDVARSLNLPYNKSRLTSDPHYNITLGSNYIHKQIKSFKGSYILAVAAYNAGPGNVRKWIRSNGDPRKFHTVEEVINWVEMIPFKETRNYVQRVIENLQVYRYVLGKETTARIRTLEDLSR